MLSSIQHNLPNQLSRFVGREQELAEIGRLLSGGRLVTLTGAGGVGKTRLALQVAADLLDEYLDGVWLVELAPLADAGLVPHALASALGISEMPGQQLTHTLVSVLRLKHVLLILDNCEHLVEASAEVADHLLRNCQRLRILATSRERLGVAGEIAWRVPSLALPDPLTITGTDEIGASEAVRLFVDRSRLAQPTFLIHDRNAKRVAQICRRLDGIPLAIELAAARMSVLSVEQILARLDDCFRLLVGGSRLAPSRQQTLLATMDWSYGLLTDSERTLFRRLSVFAGGFTLDAAEAVCAYDGIGRGDVLDLLTGLVDKSLVGVEPNDAGPARHGVLETLRQYGRQRLTDRTARDALQQRHAEYFLDLAETAARELLDSPRSGEWLDSLERDHGNFRAALQWAIDNREFSTGVRLVAALYRFWYQRGYLREGRRWCEQVLALDQELVEPSAARAVALRGDGLLAYAEGDYASARSQTEQSAAIARQLGHKPLITSALNNLGIILIDQGDYSAAQSSCEEALAIAREVGDESHTAILLNNLGLAALYQADYARAVPLLEDSLALAQARGMLWSMAWSSGNLGNAAFRQGDLATARSRFRESLSLARQVGEKRVIAERLEELAWVACAEAQVTPAVRLLGAGEAMRETIGAPMPPANRPDYERCVSLARSRLGDDTFRVVWEQGRALRVDQAIAEAMAIEGTVDAPPEPAHLTQREREVVVLVARGLSNREIAEKLVVSVRTSEAHVTHVLNKLGLRSRAQLAVWAVEHGLLNISAGT